MVTPEEVAMAYRLFLGREPENSDVVAIYCQNTQSLEKLSSIFMTSPEFIRRMSDAVDKIKGGGHHRHPLHLPKIPVETDMNSEQLKQMFERIQKKWDYLASTEPYWGVITQHQNYMAEFSKHSEQFYMTGKNTCETFLSTMRRSGVNPKHLNVCLEIGCGVGRVTRHLADSFDKIIAVDISSKYIEIAKTYLDEKNLQNIEMKHLNNLHQLLELPQVDAIFSLMTLQHNPPPITSWMISTLLSLLRPNGVAYFQIPTYKSGYLFEVNRYLASESLSDVLEMHYFPQPELFRVISEAGCRCMEVREDGIFGDDDQVLSNTLLIQKKA